MKDSVTLESEWSQDVWSVCERDVFGRDSSDEVFNPYRGRSGGVDVPDASTLRRRNFAAYLNSIGEAPDVVIVAEAPGPWGCRFSGVPITSEAQLLDPGFAISGCRTSVGEKPHSEYSAGIFWRVMGPRFPRFFVWNAFPLHPHRAGEPFSIRAPRAKELRDFARVTAAIVSVVSPTIVVALGRKAEVQLGWSGVSCVYVRHPSQGGARAFESGMRDVFGE